jgi:hypothetical protein
MVRMTWGFTGRECSRSLYEDFYLSAVVGKINREWDSAIGGCHFQRSFGVSFKSLLRPFRALGVAVIGVKTVIRKPGVGLMSPSGNRKSRADFAARLCMEPPSVATRRAPRLPAGDDLSNFDQAKLSTVSVLHSVSARSIVPAKVATTLPEAVPAASVTAYTLPMLVAVSTAM